MAIGYILASCCSPRSESKLRECFTFSASPVEPISHALLFLLFLAIVLCPLLYAQLRGSRSQGLTHLSVHPRTVTPPESHPAHRVKWKWLIWIHGQSLWVPNLPKLSDQRSKDACFQDPCILSRKWTCEQQHAEHTFFLKTNKTNVSKMTQPLISAIPHFQPNNPASGPGSRRSCTPNSCFKIRKRIRTWEKFN